MNVTVTKLKAVIHAEKEGGYWAKIPALPGCYTQGDTYDEVLSNLHEAAEGWLLAEDRAPEDAKRPVEIAV